MTPAHDAVSHQFAVPARRFAALLTVVALTACGGGGDSTKPCVVSAVAVTPGTASLVTGTTTQLTAQPTATNCSPLPTASWSSSAGGVATVSTSGLVTAVAPGTATITATAGGQSGTSTITVTPVPVATLTLTPTAPSVIVGSTVTLTAVAKDAGGNTLTGRTVNFTSGTTSVATVGNGGIVTGVAPGTSVITATSEGISATVTVTVTPVPVASVSVTVPNATVSAGQTLQATPTLRDAANNVLTGRTVTWATSASGVATVNGSGLITAVAPGTATITATSEGVNGTVGVTVIVAVNTVTIAAPTTQVLVGGTIQALATTRDASNNVLTGRPVVWSTGNAAIATVSQTGLITSVGGGFVTITATSETKSGTFIVGVLPTTEDLRYASLWANQQDATLDTPYAPSSTYSQNAAGGTNSVTRTGTGTYRVSFGKMAKVGAVANRENLFVSAYGSSGEFCRLGSWGESDADLLVDIACFDVNGAAANSRFDLALIGSNVLTGSYGFSWSSAAGAANSGSSGYRFTTGATAIAHNRSAVGTYSSVLGFTTAGPTAVLVSSYVENASCHVDGWDYSTATSNIRCAGLASATAADSRYTVMMLTAGRTGKRWGYAWADQPSATLSTPYTPHTQYQRQSNAQNVQIVRTGVGEYTVQFKGLSSATFGGTMLVSPYTNGGPAVGNCQVTGWGNSGSDVEVGVRCWSFATKALVDQRFVILAIE